MQNSTEARTRQLDSRRGFEGARLYSLRKNSEFGPVLKGHEFTRADNARRINAASAAEGRLVSLHREQKAFFRSLFSRAEIEPKKCAGFSP
jgi:hypothetical protein